MIVSKSRSFIFVHNPKCGGTRFRDILNHYNDDPRQFWGVQNTPYLNVPLDHAHLRTWELQLFFPDIVRMLRDCRSICFFRNPVERFVSAVYEHYGQFRPEVGLASRPPPEQKRIVREFAETLDLRQALTDFRYIHFSQQTWFTHLASERLVKTIIPMIDGFDAFRAAMIFLELPDHVAAWPNRAGRDAAGLLGADLVGRVRGLYEDDYRFLAGHDHMKGLTTP